MRFSLQWALLVAGVVVVSLAINGIFASRIALEEAANARDAVLRRDADRISAYVDSWLVGQRDALQGWTVPFQVDGDAALEQSLLRAVSLAVPTVRNARWESSVDGAPTELGFGALTLSEEGDTRLELTAAGPGTGARMLRVDLDLAPIQALLDDDAGPERTVLLVGDDGVAIGHGQRATSLDVDIVERLAKAASQGSFDVRSPDGGAFRGALARVQETGWTVAVLEPDRIARSAGDSIRRRTAWVVAVSAVMATALAWIMSRPMLDAISALRSTAVAVGEGHFDRRVEVRRRDELGDLLHAFNRMAAALQANAEQIDVQRAEIEAFNRELQARVDIRTRELEAAQAQLLRSGRLVAAAELGAGLAHELNNPLAAVLGLAQILRQRASGPEAGMLAKIEEQAARCREVVSAMTRLAHSEGTSVGFAAVDLRSVVGDALVWVGSAFQQRGVVLEVATGEQPLMVHVEPHGCARAFGQFLLALRAALGEGTTVQLTVESTTEAVFLSVTTDRDASSEARDDRRSAGLSWWAARRLLDHVGVGLDEARPDRSWILRFPRVSP
jgi:signal transduction histidine kinase